MSTEDDDYLSDKFLLEESKPSKPSTYSQLRKEAVKKSQIKNEQNRHKSRRQRELEAQEEGLTTSLFERAKREEEAGVSHNNKALSIMMKMGFKPGQALGNTDQEMTASGETEVVEYTQTPIATSKSVDSHAGSSPSQGAIVKGNVASSSFSSSSHAKHKAEPLPIIDWAGRKGIGLGGKRAASPSASERLAKMAKMEEDKDHRDFRDRARDEYTNRKAEGQLGPAQRTCATLDEQMGKPFNVLWLNPNNHNTFPEGLIDALALHDSTISPDVLLSGRQGDSIASRLKKQMQPDALQLIYDDDDDDDTSKRLMKSSSSTTVSGKDQYPPELLEEAAQFLRLQAQDRLQLVLSYLRDKHFYCFWCGIQYENAEAMADQCPGEDEDDH